MSSIFRSCSVAVGGFLFVAIGCGSSRGESTVGADSRSDASASGATSTAPGGENEFSPGADAGPPQPVDCSAQSQNLATCACATLGETRPCYTADPKTRKLGTCADGTQTCNKDGEFGTRWSACTGALGPQPEACNASVDTNCNGHVGCEDPLCATNPACDTACTDGATRACYTGPAGTENVGTCKDGSQTCVAGKWSACTGEVTPQAENCCDNLDHNCNRVAGCLDLFSCIASSCCHVDAGPICDCKENAVRWCDTPVGCNWGKQQCKPDGTWGPCTETTDRPAGCTGNSDPSFDEYCCLAAGECCQDFMVGGSTANNSKGNCAAIACDNAINP